MSEVGDYSTLTVAELKAELTERGLDAKGKKAELVDRLVAHDEENAADALREAEEENVDDDKTEKKPEVAENGDEAVEEVLDYIEIDEDDEDQEAEIEQKEEPQEEAKTSKTEDEENAHPEGDGVDQRKDEESSETVEEGKEKPVEEGKEKPEAEDHEEKMDTDLDEKATEKTDQVQQSLSKDEIKNTEDIAAAAKDVEEKAKQFRKRLIYRVGKNAIMSMLDESSWKKSVVVTPFELPHLDHQAVGECMKIAQCVFLQTSQSKGEFGWLELTFKTNKEAMHAKDTLSEAFKGLDVKPVDKDHIKSVTSQWEQRRSRGAEFNAQFRLCMVLATLELSEDEAKTITNFEVEDCVSPSFPGALSVAVPSTNDLFETRFILVEYGTADQATAALEAAKNKDIVVAGHKLEFDIYDTAWKAEQKLNPGRGDRGRGPRPRSRKGKNKFPPISQEDLSGPLLKLDERHQIGDRIAAVHTSIDLLKAGKMAGQGADAREKLLNSERDKLRFEIRVDDRKRRDKGLPHVQWNPSAKPNDKNKPQPKANGNKTPQWQSPNEKAQQEQQSRNPGGQRRPRNRQKRPRTDHATRDQPPQKQFRQGSNFQQFSPASGNLLQGRLGYQPQNQPRDFGKSQRNEGRGQGGYNQQRRRGNNVQRRQSGGNYSSNTGGGDVYQGTMSSQSLMGDYHSFMSSNQNMTGNNQGMHGGNQGMDSGNQGGRMDATNPVQMLLSLSKVLSNQIMRMGDDGAEGQGRGRAGGGSGYQTE